MIEVERHPCERCGGPLYYREQRERWCRPCAAHLGVERMCDHGRTSLRPELQWARDRMEEAIKHGAPADIIARWEGWIAAAEDLMSRGAPAPTPTYDPAMQHWIAQHIEDPESMFR